MFAPIQRSQLFSKGICKCDWRYWDDICEYMDNLVEDYEMLQLSEPANPAYSFIQPTEQHLLANASSTDWYVRKPEMHALEEVKERTLGHECQCKLPSQVVDGAPLPPCSHWMIKNTEAILFDWYT
jgi:hypothetical protein